MSEREQANQSIDSPPESALQKADVPRIVRSLLGAIPYTDMTLSELREERLRKYDTAD